MPNLRGVTAVVVAIGAGYAAWLLSGWGGPNIIRVLDDVGLVGFAAFAAVGAALAARRERGRDRVAWNSLAFGAGGWAAGEAMWSYYDLVADSAPFPSPADAGFVLFPVGAALYLIFSLAAYPRETRLRLVLDGVIVGAAIFGAAWLTLLGTVYRAEAADPVSLALALGYPVVDLALVTIAVLMLVRAPALKRAALSLVTCGLLLIAVSDTAFAYLTAVDGFYEDHFIAIGWAWGFLCIGMAGIVSRRSPRVETDTAAHVPSRTTAWLPYIPVLLSVAVCTPLLIGGLGVVFISALVTVLAVMIRQFLVIGENRRLLVEVADQALRDPLTGLGNRTLFSDRLSHAMQLRERQATAVAVLLIDLDHFKLVNDSFGHPVGDVMLIRVAERLIGTVRASDTVVRLGGDEFAVLMEGEVEASYAVAQSVVTAFDRSFSIDGQCLRVRPSVGLAIATADDDALTADELLKQADVAMYTAKRSRSNQLFTFTPDMDLDGLDDSGLESPVMAAGTESSPILSELRDAIDHCGLSVVYQPKFDLRTGEIVGLEALIRWPHPQRGLLNPDQFLPLVRQHGLMRSLTIVVLELALDDAAKWYDMGVGVPVAVNVFAPAMAHPGLCEQITHAVERRGLAPESLTVEVTEDLLLDNMGRASSVFNKLRSKGIRVAIDDFGSGYSALWYLREFSVDEVKLDREFIAPILTNEASAVIVRAVIDLAHALGITPVAEGVENAETAARLLDYGCDVAQGFHYSPPLPGTAILNLLQAQRQASLTTRPSLN